MCLVLTPKDVLTLENMRKNPDFDINELNKDKQNALFDANISKFKWLIKNGINVHHIDNYQRNALFYATTYKKFSLLKKENICMTIIDYRNEHFLFEISKAKKTFIMPLIRENEKDIQPLLNHKNFEGINILFYICGIKDINVSDLDYLMSLGVEYHLLDNNQHNIFMHCIESLEAFEFFIKHDIHNKIPFSYESQSNLLYYITAFIIEDLNNSAKEMLELLFTFKNEEFYKLYYALISEQGDDYAAIHEYLNVFVSEKERALLLSKPTDLCLSVPSKRI